MNELDTRAKRIRLGVVIFCVALFGILLSQEVFENEHVGGQKMLISFRCAIEMRLSFFRRGFA